MSALGDGVEGGAPRKFPRPAWETGTGPALKRGPSASSAGPVEPYDVPKPSEDPASRRPRTDLLSGAPGPARGVGARTAADVHALLGSVPAPTRPLVQVADGPLDITAYLRLRHEAFVVDQGLFAHHDVDDVDDDPRVVVLLARNELGVVVGGVRLAPATATDIGWWRGGRLVVAPGSAPGVGAALVRAACAHAEAAGALRFDATVQARHEPLFARLGWHRVDSVTVAGRPHVQMEWPIGRVAALVAATKRDLGDLLADWTGAPAGFLGDDGAPVDGTDVVAVCDAIMPSMVERDPHWAGWCSVLVNLNDLSAMGAEPVALLDTVGGRDRSFVHRVLSGLRAAAEAYGVPVIGGHTQLGVPAALAVTALGRTEHPVPAGGARPGQRLRLTADLGGQWRPGYTGRQWDSTTSRTGAQLRAMGAFVASARPAAAKDVSMAGVLGTLGMLAEASGCAAEVDVADVPRPAGTTAGDWLTCFPGFAVLTSHDSPDVPGAGPATSAVCGGLVAGAGVRLRWPDGRTTTALDGPVTGLGAA